MIKPAVGGTLDCVNCVNFKNFRSVKVIKSALFAKFREIGCVFVTVLQARNREEKYTSCACVRDGFCKGVFVTVFTSPADATPVADGYRRLRTDIANCTLTAQVADGHRE